VHGVVVELRRSCSCEVVVEELLSRLVGCSCLGWARVSMKSRWKWMEQQLVSERDQPGGAR
jgi:hypothetical protein